MPYDNEPPAASYATLDTRNAQPCLDFDGSADEEAVFSFIVPSHYAAGGVPPLLPLPLFPPTPNPPHNLQSH